jgi:hypothetical protein
MNWYSGNNNCKTHYIINDNFYTIINNQSYQDKLSIDDIFIKHLNGNKTVDLLYSGGTDSELVLNVLRRNKINVKPCIIKLSVNDAVINTHDLYYAEKFSRENGIKLYYFNLDLKTFLIDNIHLELIGNYLINQPHVASHFWLIKQLQFPIMGGDWPWVHTHKVQKVLSPIKIDYSYYDQFMLDNNITGIGNMLSHSIESLMYFVSLQLKTNHLNDYIVKHTMYKTIVPEIENRLRSYGWEHIDPKVIQLHKYKIDLLVKNKQKKMNIKWGEQICELLQTPLMENNTYV